LLLGRREAADVVLWLHAAQSVGEDTIVGDLLAGTQGRFYLVALALELFLGDAFLHLLLQDRGCAGAVAELGLFAPDELVREPAVEGLPEEALLGLVFSSELLAGGEREPELDHLTL
jgi:hypothetical protein